MTDRITSLATGDRRLENVDAKNKPITDYLIVILSKVSIKLNN